MTSPTLIPEPSSKHFGMHDMPLLLILSILSPLVPLLVGFRKRNTLLWIYPLIALLFDLSISFAKRAVHANFDWLANGFMLTEFILISFLFRKRIFRNNAVFSVCLAGLGLLFLIHTGLNSFFSFNMTGSSAFLFAYLIYGIFGLYTILKKPDTVHIERSWFFWLNVAVIIYAAAAFPMFLFRDQLRSINKGQYWEMWKTIYFTTNITKNLLLGVALYHFCKPLRHEPV